MNFFLVIIFFVGACLVDGRKGYCNSLPVPTTVSPEIQRTIIKPISNVWDVHPQNSKEWKRFANKISNQILAGVPHLTEAFDAKFLSARINDVPVYWVRSKKTIMGNDNGVIMHIHGGGYVIGSGEAGLPEAILMSGASNYNIVSVDYRMPPDYPYPAALNDIVSVYKGLLTKYPANKIGVFGSSTGGALTLALVLKLKEEQLPLPAAIAPGSPWSDLNKVGDTYYSNEHVDNVLVSYDGWLGDAAKLYANGHDLKDPLLSPVYGDFSDFPPTFLTSGTRDLFLSNTVRVQNKLLKAGVETRLIVFEGLSHVQYYLVSNSSESRFYFKQLSKFFNNYLN